MIDNLLLGNYYLKELSSAKDNKVTDTYYNINLTYEDQYTEKVLESIDVYNYINKGGIVINKFDKDTNSPLKNTLIEIRTLDNKVIYKGYTDEKGQIIINDLKYGDYYLAETEASTGYQLLEEKIPFTIDKEITTIDIYNERIPVPNTGIRINVYTIIPIISMLVSIIILLIIHNKKRFNILLITVIFLSLTVESIYYIKSYSDKAQNTKAVEAFFTNKISTNYNEKYRYNSILEIPSINLKRGILDINNEYNTAKYNIELIKENTNLIVLASHNGNYYNSFFGHLNNLELGDEINYYKNGIKYKYIYTDSYEIKKDGYADLYHKNDQKSIILITCKDNTDDGQVVHIGYLKDSTPF